MKKMIFSIIALCAMAFGLKAHDFYINLSESMEHKPGSIGVNIGWGHALPFDDFFMGNSLEKYEIYDPNMKKTEFKFDKAANEGIETRIYQEKPSKDFPEALIFNGDMLANKVYFTDTSAKGVYQVAAATRNVQFSTWKDEKGREKWGRIYLNEIKGAKEISMSLNFQSFAKAYVSVGEWKKPKPIGHDLEIIPISDLSNLKVGDEVELEVLFMGEPLNEKINDMPIAIKAHGEQSGAGFIGSYINSNGKTKFRVTSSGRWLAVVNLRKDINEKIAPELVGKALQKGYNATATFYVKAR